MTNKIICKLKIPYSKQILSRICKLLDTDRSVFNNDILESKFIICLWLHCKLLLLLSYIYIYIISMKTSIILNTLFTSSVCEIAEFILFWINIKWFSAVPFLYIVAFATILLLVLMGWFYYRVISTDNLHIIWWHLLIDSTLVRYGSVCISWSDGLILSSLYCSYHWSVIIML